MKRKLFISLGILAAVLIVASVAVYLFVPHQRGQLDALKHHTSEHDALQQDADSAIGTDSTTAVSQTPNYAEMLEEQNILYQYHNDSLERTFYEIYDRIEDWRKVVVKTRTRDNTTVDSIGEIKYDINFYVDPDENYFYLVDHWHNAYSGWTWNIILEKYDLHTGAINKFFIDGCAALRVDKRGFTMAEARLTNEATATCAADEIYLMHDVHIDWNGDTIAVSSQEYDWRTMEKRYGTHYVKGFCSSIYNPEKYVISK
ncbi:MAG: hypothetical protein IJ680_05970 [Paludibacteraceae bacterium]|nr:hypothetical protein [Paludibacteraceae bacterium]